MIKSFIGAVTLIFFIMVLLLGLLYWLELINIIPSKILVNFVSGVIEKNTSEVEVKNISDAFLLEKIRLEKQYEALQLEREKLLDLEQRVLKREEELLKNEETLRIREEEVNSHELVLNLREKTIENKDEGIRYNVQTLLNMLPVSAVEIMNGYDDQQLIDTLIIADKIAEENDKQSLVPNWLSLMDPQRVAEIQKKITYR